eukprot:390225-Pleurochrysis_carterae.AAC.1
MIPPEGAFHAFGRNIGYLLAVFVAGRLFQGHLLILQTRLVLSLEFTGLRSADSAVSRALKAFSVVIHRRSFCTYTLNRLESERIQGRGKAALNLSLLTLLAR